MAATAEEIRQWRSDLRLKIVIIGDSGVGKSCLLRRFLGDSGELCLMSTLGVDFGDKFLQVGQKRVKLQIWDTAGQERFRTITTGFFRNADGVLLVYDVSQAASFRALHDWIVEANAKAPKGVHMLIVGNKCDLEGDREVKTEEGEAFAQKCGFNFFETSAKESINVEKPFDSLTDSIVKLRFAPAPVPASAAAASATTASNPAAAGPGTSATASIASSGSTTQQLASAATETDANNSSESESLDLNGSSREHAQGWGSRLWSWC